MIRNEADAIAELQRLLAALDGAAVSRELAAANRAKAVELLLHFPPSPKIKGLSTRIDQKAAPPLRPRHVYTDRCRALAERLHDRSGFPEIMEALRVSGFASQPVASLKEV